FEQAGLQPKGTDGFLQPFEFVKKISQGPSNKLTVNGVALQINEEWMPMNQSASKSFSFGSVIPVEHGIVTEDSAYNDYAGKQVEGQALLIKRYAPADSVNPHVDFTRYSNLTDKILTATSRKAAAVFFVTPSDHDDTLQLAGLTHVTPKDVPIIFLRRKALEKLGLSIDSPVINSAVGQVELIPVKDTGYNVIGYLPAESDTTVVVGAHFDHLGWGGVASRHAGGERLIHYGADDNGSGTAGLIELARYFASRQDQLHYSMLFGAFSGEEAGILGSAYYVKHMTVDSSKIRMMLNMDMIGRLRDQESGLAIFGTGTATEFADYFKDLTREDLQMAFREPGTGPSDHTAFYNSGIPVLHFFTGAHEDYHKPSDTPDKIDSEGTLKVVSLVADIAMHFDSLNKPLNFQRTKDPDEGKRRSSFSVTLGIMPDYVAQVKGVKVDGVTPDRPGERAGILKGDTIIKMGTLVIDDIYAYMNALGKYRKGDSITVVIERGADTLDLPVVFK
ncbi:MAG: M28 family peptidase, partial [candidate division Zixibacteria bacterium]|nr:M28 family peptidase [candidate division Zixibacteria bacterium]